MAGAEEVEGVEEAVRALLAAAELAPKPEGGVLAGVDPKLRPGVLAAAEPKPKARDAAEVELEGSGVLTASGNALDVAAGALLAALLPGNWNRGAEAVVGVLEAGAELSPKEGAWVGPEGSTRGSSKCNQRQ